MPLFLFKKKTLLLSGISPFFIYFTTYILVFIIMIYNKLLKILIKTRFKKNNRKMTSKNSNIIDTKAELTDLIKRKVEVAVS